MRCPLSTMKNPTVQRTIALYDAYENGHLPQGRGISRETAAYRNLISRASMLKGEAELWFSKQKPKGNDGG